MPRLLTSPESFRCGGWVLKSALSPITQVQDSQRGTIRWRIAVANSARRVSFPPWSYNGRKREDTSVPLGCVIARQRPGTALGFIFLSMEDETGIANIIIHPQLYERERALVTRAKFLKVSGKLQNQDGVIHVKADKLDLLQGPAVEVRSHDFH